MIERKKIAVLTSGGDAPGMNACLRGLVRAALNRGWEVQGIRDAFRGLVEGGDNIFSLDWVDVSWAFRDGGTFLGSARFPEVTGDGARARELKEKALLNLKRRGISGLVVLGGDGSLTGAYELFTYLKNHGPLNPELKDLALSIIGIPGSIDNDIAFTDMSIGADTTLNTIVECIDKLRDTAASHRRINIVEVMGRLRGYLAVMSGLAAGADQIFIREEKMTRKELNAMLELLKESFAQGQKAGIVIRSEGAFFSTGFIKETIAGLLEPKKEVRETVLGHLQRGGNPTGFERILATRMGVKAVQFLADASAEPLIIGLSEGVIKGFPLADCISRIMTPEFRDELSSNSKSAFRLNSVLEAPPSKAPSGLRIGILTDGNNVSGMNMAIRAVARLAINNGLEVVGIKGGFSGLAQGEGSAFFLDWKMLEMKGILRRAGTLLGVSGRGIPTDEKALDAMSRQVEELNIHGLVVIGNNAAYECASRLSAMISRPLVGIPAALSCNLPGTNWIIGMDSALNDLVKGIDRAVDAAQVLRKIFLVSIRGDFCSCMIKSAALAGGAEIVIIDEYGSDNRDAFRDEVAIGIRNLQRIMSLGKGFATVVFFSRQSEKTDEGLEMVQQAIRDAGIPLETSVISLATSLGGIVPTAFDRIVAQRLGEKAIDALLKQMSSQDLRGFTVVGSSRKEIAASPYSDYRGAFHPACSAPFLSELDQCFALMAQPGEECVGMGGDLKWKETRDGEKWDGLWTCRRCGHSQAVVFRPSQMLCIFCEGPACNNYGYIRISRRL